MTRRRAIRAVLHNFLGTYTSRDSDYDGYWLFGLLVGRIEGLDVDLLRSKDTGSNDAITAFAVQLAVDKFREQAAKAGIPISFLREAWLNIAKSASVTSGAVNGHICRGFDLGFVATVVSDAGKTYEAACSVFVAPHDPKVELRRVRHL